jgi:polar amino acid transport system substrate-binding protein
MFKSSRWAAAGLVFLFALQGCAHEAAKKEAGPGVVTPEIKQALAPQGSLRVAVYRGSPTSYVQADASAAPTGVGYDLGQEFAKRLGVNFDPKVYPNNAQALAAIESGDADFAFTNATSERAEKMDFSPTVLDVEKSMLVVKRSRLKTLDDVKKRRLRIGVSAGSSTGSELKPLFPRARLVPIDTLDKAIDALRRGRIDAFATNDAILYQMSDSDKLKGSRVLEGHWGMEHFAIAVPKGREAGQQWIAEFVKDAVAKGQVQAAADRANVRGVAQPE